ncbi:unnamed protein product [Ilex paraguariensis]|uniref:Uncharacterized protein n=1 Tax=Ilex paraguariensis TaxID=185542 RepID=A0ABC8V646_9AQUA
MEPAKDPELNTTAAAIDVSEAGDHRSVVVELPLGDSAATFNLEKAICSHGLFMMAPNHWDPLTKTLRRPLRLDPEDDQDVSVSSSFLVQISHPLTFLTHSVSVYSTLIFSLLGDNKHCWVK